MINEKLILETLASQTERLGTLQTNLAAMYALVESRLPGLSPSEKQTLKKGVELLLKSGEQIQSDGENLRRAIQKLGLG